MRRIVSLLVLACLVFAALAPASAQAERRVALIIGNGGYKQGPLKNPPNDARDMAATLKSLGFEVILRENASLRQMNEAIDQFWQGLKKGGVGLFFFAGHGLQVGGENYLVPVDAKVALEKDVQYECVNAGRVLARMEDAGNGLNIVILDACRNNPFARSFRSESRGLAKMDAPTGSLVAFATAPGDVAADGDGRNGLYTSHLLRHLRSPGLTIENVLKQTRIGVAQESAKMGKRQTPWESSSLMGDFFFVGGQGGGQQLASLAPVQAPPIQVQAVQPQPVQTQQIQPAPQPAAQAVGGRFDTGSGRVNSAPASQPGQSAAPSQADQVANAVKEQILGTRISRPRPGVALEAPAAAEAPAVEKEFTALKVRIIYIPSMQSTAEKAQAALREQGVNAELFRFTPNGAEKSFGGKVYYSRGMEAHAQRIIETMRPVETLRLSDSPSTIMGSGLDISFWLAR